ncbi:MAG TPA: glycosyltransferase family 39 protein, partial [Acidobacteriaceae bacterium]
AYLRVPLFLAGIAFLIGTFRCARSNGRGTMIAIGVMMVLFFQAARLALVAFDPYLSSRPLAEALLRSPSGKLIVDHHYYTFSSIAWYTGRNELLLNGRWNNFEYGSNAPDVPDVFLDDAKLAQLWRQPQRYYLVAKDDQIPRFDSLLGASHVQQLLSSGGKVLLTNHAE